MFCPMKIDTPPVFITPPFEPEINLRAFGLNVDYVIKLTPSSAKNTEPDHIRDATKKETNEN
jgi:hypothetical protein